MAAFTSLFTSRSAWPCPGLSIGEGVLLWPCQGAVYGMCGMVCTVCTCARWYGGMVNVSSTQGHGLT